MNRNLIPRLPPLEVPSGGDLRRILFVCDGNICRSPAALAFLQGHQAAGRLPGWVADSAGLIAGHGDVPLATTCLAARGEGIPLESHRARHLAPAQDRPHLALIMEDRQRVPVMQVTGLGAERVLMLGAFATDAGDPAIPDPFGATAATYTACLRQIRAAVDGLVAWLEQVSGC